MLRLENGLLRKQNVITSQVEYYYFVDGVHHIFLAPAINPKEIIFFFPPPPSPPSVDGLYMTVFEDVATNVATFTGQQYKKNRVARATLFIMRCNLVD